MTIAPAGHHDADLVVADLFVQRVEDRTQSIRADLLDRLLHLGDRFAANPGAWIFNLFVPQVVVQVAMDGREGAAHLLGNLSDAFLLPEEFERGERRSLDFRLFGRRLGRGWWIDVDGDVVSLAMLRNVLGKIRKTIDGDG